MWAVLVPSFLVGLPIFFEVGFIILVPLVWSLARESKRSLLFFGMAMCAPLTITAFAGAAASGARRRRAIARRGSRALRFSTARCWRFPWRSWAVSSLARFIGKRIFVPVPEIAESLEAPMQIDGHAPPPVALVILLLMLPVLLILARHACRARQMRR